MQNSLRALLILFLFVIKDKVCGGQSTRVTYLQNLTSNVIELVKNHTDRDIFDEDSKMCQGAMNDLKSDVNMIENIIIFSGKSFSDVGREEECLSNNLTYVLLEAELNLSIYYGNSSYGKYYQFVNQKRFFIGLCLLQECTKLYENFFNMTRNSKLSSLLHEQGITNLSLYKTDFIGNEEDKWERYNSEYNMQLIDTVLWIVFCYVIFRVIMTFTNYVLYEYQEDEQIAHLPQTKNIFTKQMELEQIDEAAEDDSIFHKLEFQFLNSGGFRYHKKYKSTLMYQLCSIFSIRKAFKILFKKHSKYYNENDLRLLTGIRIFILFFLSLNNNTFAITKLPHREYGRASFYSSFWFFVVKLGTLSAEGYKALNGFYLGYKILSYIKRKGRQFTFQNMLIFYLKTLPQFVMLIVCVFLHVHIMELGLHFGGRMIFEYFISKNVNFKQCVGHPFGIFIPFYYQYIHIASDDHTYPVCFKSLHFVTTEFYCFTFIVLMVYMIMKIKSIRVDVLIYVCNIILLLLSYFSYHHDIIGSPYLLTRIYGSAKNYIYPHLFIVVYFFGFNIGMMYFYHKDITSSYPFSHEDYIPFSFNYDIMIYLDTSKSQVLLYALQFVSLAVLTLLVFSFNILLYIYGKSSQDLIIEGNWFIEILFIYEGHLFGIFSLLFLTSLLFYNGKFYFKEMLGANIFLSANRLSFAYFCTQDYIVYLVYAWYNIEIFLNYQNAIFMSLALLVISVIFSILMMVFFELPVRMIYWKCTGSRRRKVISYINPLVDIRKKNVS